MVFKRTVELFRGKLLFRSLLLLTTYFCLSFGSYGVSLWYPTYVNQINEQRDAEVFQAFCSEGVSNLTGSTIPAYCGCNEAYINNSTISDLQLENFVIEGTVFSNVTFERVDFVHSSFRNTTFESGSFIDCTFNKSTLNEIIFNAFTFKNLWLESSRLCGVLAELNTTSDNVTTFNTSINQLSWNTSRPISGDQFTDMLNSTNTSQCQGEEWSFQCPRKEDDFRVYRDSFFVSASALPGNLAEMVAVYFLIRKYWLSFSFFLSTISVFLLYVVHDEVVVVVMLCIFTAISTPAWNDSSLIVAEVYPTHLRSTAAGVHLSSARIGAIIGTNVFGQFVHVNPSIPIILVGVLLFVGAVAALFLPKTTRKTLLK